MVKIYNTFAAFDDASNFYQIDACFDHGYSGPRSRFLCYCDTLVINLGSGLLRLQSGLVIHCDPELVEMMLSL